MRHSVRHIVSIVILSLMTGLLHAVPLEPGLVFRSYETQADSRTGLSVDEIGFRGELSLSFDMKVDPDREHFGYICRLVLDDLPAIDLFLSTPVSSLPFVGLASAADRTVREILPYREMFDWNTLALDLQSDRDGTVSFFCGQTPVATIQGKKGRKHTVRLLFGANSDKGLATMDVAPMTIRNLRIAPAGKKAAYLCPLLSETDLASPSPYRLSVQHPSWLTDTHRFWQPALTIHTEGKGFLADDAPRGLLYLVTADRVFRIDLKNEKVDTFLTTAISRPDLLTNDFFVGEDGSLAYVDVDVLPPFRAVFSPEKGDWEPAVPPRRRHSRFSHHNSLQVPPSGKYVQLFGYGFHQYLDDLVCISPDGDSVHRALPMPPRYLAGIGLHGRKAILAGGKGNPHGRQELGVQVYQDIWELDLDNFSLREVGSFENEAGEVPAQRLLVSGDTLTALFFNPNAYKSALRLKQILLPEGTMKAVGDSIPFNFLDTESYALLTPAGDELFCSVTFREDESRFASRVYRLDLPLFVPTVPDSQKKRASLHLLWLLLLPVLFAVFAVARNKSRKVTKDIHPEAPPLKTGLHLLGGLRIIDRDGRDISGAFSPMMRQLTALLVVHSAQGRGISNAEMKEILWPDKPEESFYNNRGVTIKKIRKELAAVSPSIEIKSEGGYWSILVPEQLCDYLSALALLNDSQDAESLTSTALSGPLLPDIRYEWLDKFKAAYADQVISVLGRLNHPGRLGPQARLKVSDAILLFDSIDEDAVRNKCQALIQLKRAGTARSEFDAFASRYSSLMGEKFGTPFLDFVAEKTI